ncbi:redoxin domain-containing protein [Methanohalobium evestigatum]|uniref:redoxin domain-containing protein n=1 Tax=Methanohalobium evestigatum TaxID=2322 RepID=UPI00067823E1|nr:redoxin domain-containing protein [Methanohalobium evestigatum]
MDEYAADFTLKDQNDEKYTLSDFKNQKILLSFHPLAWTVVCAKHMQLLENNYKQFKDLNTTPLGISVDPVPSKNA